MNASKGAECGFNTLTIEVVGQLQFLAYSVLNQVYLVVGLSGNVVLLIAFYGQSKTEKAYGYQVILTVSKTLEIFTLSVFLTTLKRFSGAETSLADWFVKNYPLMILTARVGPVAAIALIICSLLLALSMAADRLFAMTKPFIYKNINRTRHQMIATLICFSISVISSISDAWRYDVVVDDDRYKMIVNEAYVETGIAHVGAHMRTALRVVGVVGLIWLNTAISIIFRKKSMKVGQMTTCDRKEQARRAAEKNLLLLNIYQAILMAINQIPHMGYHILANMIPSFTACSGIIYSPTADAMIMLTDSVDLFILTAVNKKMRRMVASVFPCLKVFNDQTATTSTGNTGARSAEPLRA